MSTGLLLGRCKHLAFNLSGQYINQTTRLWNFLPPIHSGQVINCFNTAASREDATEDILQERIVPKTKEEVEALGNQPFRQPQNPKVLRVSIVGLPNAGKSTLINKLMSWRVCSVSKKVHTTRHKSKIVMVEGDTQIVFLDTPGIVGSTEFRKHRLDDRMLLDPVKSLSEADLVAVIADISSEWNRQRLDSKVIYMLEKHQHKPAILILNKVDTLKKKITLLDITTRLTCGIVGGYRSQVVKEPGSHTKQVEDITNSRAVLEDTSANQEDILERGGMQTVQNLHFPTIEKHVDPFAGMNQDHEEMIGWPGFNEVFMISALNGDGVSDLKSYLLQKAVPQQWTHHPAIVTDQPPYEIAVMAVREKLMDHLPKEIPYILKPVVQMWHVDDLGTLRIVMDISCPRKNLLTILIGPGGKRVGRIAEEARQQLSNTFRCEVSLKLIVRLKGESNT